MATKYTVVPTNQFKKDLKKAQKRGLKISLIEEVVDKIANGVQLESKYKDHWLNGNFEGYRECHITPDWLLVYRIKEDILVLTLSRTGTHSDLF